LHKSMGAFGEPIRLIPYVQAFKKGLTVMSAKELLAATFPPREQILGPWLPDKGLAMLYAPRGVGKTFLALSIAFKVATGGQMLGWKAPRPRRIVYLDGEMPAAVLQERFASIVRTSNVEVDPGYFRLVAADFQQDGLPDLSDAESQRFYEDAITDSDLIVVDNLMTVAGGFKENDADSYYAFQSWLADSDEAGHAFQYEAGRPFRSEAGQRSDLMSATDCLLSQIEVDDVSDVLVGQVSVDFRRSDVVFAGCLRLDRCDRHCG
jgi:AAA domain